MKSNESLKDVTTHFEFGRNWAEYSETITEARIANAQIALQRLLGDCDLQQLSFLDIGCGSGIHSLAALNLGAETVDAVDIDPVSVQTAESVLARADGQGQYQVKQGSIFNLPYEPGQQFDVVYSWGVLHHTGSMWEAIDKATQMVAPGGRLILAIYLKTPFCGFWKLEKRLFTALPSLARLPIVWLYSALCFLRIALTGKNPVQHIREYQRFRGMNWYRDRIDWLGGYPYESASPGEIEAFVSQRGGRLARSFDTKPSLGLLSSGCAEYVFDMGESEPASPDDQR